MSIFCICLRTFFLYQVYSFTFLLCPTFLQPTDTNDHGHSNPILRDSYDHRYMSFHNNTLVQANDTVDSRILLACRWPPNLRLGDYHCLSSTATSYALCLCICPCHHPHRLCRQFLCAGRLKPCCPSLLIVGSVFYMQWYPRSLGRHWKRGCRDLCNKYGNRICSG